MNDDKSDIQEIFCLALDRESPAERQDFLDAACRGDAQLRAEVKKLLDSHYSAGNFLKGHTRTDLCADTDGVDGNAIDSRTTPHVDDIPLDFLDSPGQPGSLGRLGQYDILEAVSRGGMGIVLKAQDAKLNRVVAVKVLAPELASNPTARKRFSREAQAAAAVSHDHVVTIYAVEDGDGNDGLPYLVMEYIDGESLQQKIDREGQLELREILRIGRQIAAGLAAAHEQGLIHRDVKPSNILLQNGVQRVQITDFGLARAVDDVGMTHTGEVTGTPQYMSPEQAQGLPVDPRSDLFNLGSVLYAMCTGRSPFRAETSVAALRRVCDDAPRSIREINPDVPDWLVAIIDRLLEKDSDDRFQTAEDVSALLGKHLAHVQDRGSTPFPGVSRALPQRAPRTKGRSQRWVAAGLVLLAVCAMFGVTEATGVTELSATVIRIVTGEGTLVIEVDDPSVEVSLDGEELSITGAGLQELRLRPGQYQFQATKDGEPIKQELVTITRGDRRTVRVLLEPEPSVPSRDFVAPQSLQPKVVPIGDSRLLETHENGVYAVAFSPNGRFAATAGGDEIIPNTGLAIRPGSDFDIRLWDVDNGELTRQFTGHTSSIYFLKFSPDGKHILSGGRDTTARLWDVESGEEVRKFSGHSMRVFCGAFSPDGRFILTGGEDRKLIKWSLRGEKLWEEVYDSDLSIDSVWCVAFSPNGESAISGHGHPLLAARERGYLCLWNAETGREIRRLEGHAASPRAVYFTSDGKRAISAGHDWTIRDWDLESGNELRQIKHQEAITTMVVSADGTHALTGGFPSSRLGRGGLVLWNLESGTPTHELIGHSQYVCGVALSPDGRRALSGAFDRAALLWRLPESVQSTRSSATQPNGVSVVTESRILAQHEDIVYAVAFAPDSRYAATAGGERQTESGHLVAGTDFDIRICNVESGKVVHRLTGHTSSVYCLSFSPDGRYLVSGSRDLTLRLWDVASGEEIRQFLGHSFLFYDVAFSPDGRFLLSGGRDRRLIKWSVEEGRKIWERIVNDAVWCVAISPDGELAITGHGDPNADNEASLWLWDAETGEPIRRLDGHTRAARSVSFTPDGKRIVSVGHDQTIRTWDVVSGNELTRIDHNVLIPAMALSPQGDYVLIGGARSHLAGTDGMSLWNLQTGQPVLDFWGHTQFVHSVALSPDGRYALSGSYDSTARLWRLPKDIWPSASDRSDDLPFAVLNSDSEQVSEFNTLAEAVLRFSPGDTIEIRGDGPYVTDPIEIRNRPLVIRAARSRRPVLRLSPAGAKTNEPMLKSDASLVVEGIEWQRLERSTDSRDGRAPIVIEGGGPILYVANCSFFLDGGAQQVCIYAERSDTSVAVHNCQFVVRRSPSVCISSGNLISRCHIRNCVQVGGHTFFCFDHGYPHHDGTEVLLSKNTLLPTRPAVGFHAHQGFTKGERNDLYSRTRVEASENLVDANVLLNFHVADSVTLAHNDAETLVRHLFEWHDQNNLYSIHESAVSWHLPESLGAAPAVENLEEWGRFWNEPETAFADGLVRYEGGDLVSRLDASPESITPEDFRLRPDSAGYQAGPDGEGLGADIDFVGPGEAYTRWTRTDEYRHWRNEVDTRIAGEVEQGRRPFAILDGDGMVVHRFDSLTDAVLGSTPGDTIEIRGNGPFLTPQIAVSHPLAIRAGIGFQPVIRHELRASLGEPSGAVIAARSQLTLEGIRFEYEQLMHQGGNRESITGHLIAASAPIRVANCSFHVNAAGIHHALWASSDVTLENCLFLRGTALWMTSDNARFKATNTVFASPVAIHHDLKHHDAEARFRQNSVLAPLFVLFDSIPDDIEALEQESVLRIDASSNLISTDESFMILGVDRVPSYPERALTSEAAESRLPHCLKWTENHNLYTVDAPLLGLTNYGVNDLGTRCDTLDEWNQLWGQQETGSAVGQLGYQGGDLSRRIRENPGELRIDDFRLRPDSDGFQADPEGEDIGANVGLVGPGEAYERWKQTEEFTRWEAEIVELLQVEDSAQANRENPGSEGSADD